MSVTPCSPSAFTTLQSGRVCIQRLNTRQQREEQVAHVQPFQLLDHNWNHLQGKQRDVYRLGTQFHNDKLVRRSPHKRYSGLMLWSPTRNLGKSSYMNMCCDIGRVYRHTHSDIKWQDTFDTGTEPEHAYFALLHRCTEKYEKRFALYLRSSDLRTSRFRNAMGRNNHIF